MKDYSFSATASCSIGLTASGSTGCIYGYWTTSCGANSTLVLGAEESLRPTRVGCTLVCHAELQTRVCRKGTSEMNCCALGPQGWRTHGRFKGRTTASGIINSREISSVKSCCFHLARARERKFSGGAYYLRIMPSKTNLKHRNTILMMDYFQEEYSIQNSLNIHQHCCRLVTPSPASLQWNAYILMSHQFCRYVNS